MKIIIKEMALQDAAAAAHLEARLFSMPWSEEGFRTSLEQPDTLYLAVWDKDLLVGYCGLLQSFDEADITNVAVAPEYQNMGVGHQMLSRLMTLGRERGIGRYTLEVRVSNAAAIHLYEKLGFQSVGIRKGFYEKPKEDAYIMWTGEI